LGVPNGMVRQLTLPARRETNSMGRTAAQKLAITALAYPFRSG
jgi:hypothetical protein